MQGKGYGMPKKDISKSLPVFLLPEQSGSLWALFPGHLHNTCWWLDMLPNPGPSFYLQITEGDCFHERRRAGYQEEPIKGKERGFQALDPSIVLMIGSRWGSFG